MRFDPATPTAVFLGPSLAPAEARQLLPANYYPPVRLGDVYRLLASGVHRIAIIDGVFHQSTPVWQRELLAAIDEGIEVVGGASMGALRAAELAHFGMRGIGIVYDWYRQRLIDGDDEVALLHTDAELGYRALSEPLVNLRYNLARACAAGIIDADQRDALIERLQARCFTERSWQEVNATAKALGFADSQQAALREFIETSLVDIKRADALAVLAHCAQPLHAPSGLPRERWSYPGDAMRPLLQSACNDHGELVAGEDRLRQLLSEPSTVSTYERALRRRFFLLAAFDALAGEKAEAAVTATAAQLADRALHDRDALRRQGLSRADVARECAERARLAWLAEAAPPVTASAPATTQAREATWIAAWAQVAGIEAATLPTADGPPGMTAEQDLTERLLACGPQYLGYTHWNVQAALLRALRFDALHLET